MLGDLRTPIRGMGARKNFTEIEQASHASRLGLEIKDGSSA